MAAVRLNDRHRWGIIYCPRIGVVNKMKKWREIRAYLVEKKITYDYIQSEDYGSVERLACMLADNGYETIVVVGGDGALQDALNGIMVSECRSRISLGIIPNGIANDFANYWGLDEDDYKGAIDYIIAGRTRRVDVGCCRYETENGERKRYFLNAVNIGMNANIVELSNRNVRVPFAKYLSYFRSFLLLLMHRNSYNVKMYLNNQCVEMRLMMLCVGNARGYGMTPSAVPYNGYLDVSAIKMPKFFGLIKGIYMLWRKRIMNYRLMLPFRTVELSIESSGGALAGIDGRPFRPSYPLHISILHEELNLIIPK